MKIRVEKENINTKEYIEEGYKDPNWKNAAPDILKRLILEVSLLKDKQVTRHLDVGCADGDFTKLMLEQYPNSTGYGLDISENVISHAGNNCSQGNFIVGSCYSLPFEDASFDLVHSAEMVEHLEEPEKALAEMYRVLKPGGTLIFTTVNESATPYEEHLWKWDIAGIMSMVKPLKLKNVYIKPKFFNESILRVEGTK